MRSAIHVAVVATTIGSWSFADNTVDEVVVEVPHTIIETQLQNFGMIAVKYRAPDSSYDEVAFLQRTREIPAHAHAFGVQLIIDSSPRRRIRVAEVWSHPNLRNPETNEREAFTVMSHMLDPPDVYAMYFPLYEYGWLPTGSWVLNLYLVDEPGPDGQNVSMDDDPSQFAARGVKPFFEYAFQVQGD